MSDPTREMLEDARLQLDMLREAIGVSVEPHQSLFERMMERARRMEESDQELAERIHYPQCWDTAAYSTLHDALLEVTASCGCSECKAAIAAQNPEKHAPTWEPIETAPKGRRVLVRTESEIYAATWVQNPLTGDVAFCVGRIGNPDGDNDQMLIYPKEWMELPIAAQKHKGGGL